MRNGCHEQIKPAPLLCGNLTSTQTSSALDTLGFKEALVTLTIGAVTGTSPTLDVTIRSSTTSGGTYATIATFAQKTTGGTATAPVSYVGRIQLDGQSRYLKAVATIAGTSPVFPCSVVVDLMQPVTEPVTQTNTLEFNLDPT